MNDYELWLHGIEMCQQFCDSLPAHVKPEYSRLLERIMRCKSEMMELVSSSGSAERCRQCGGECCLFGKYHVTSIEILAHLQTGVTIPFPDFTANPHCPYSNSSGCLMDESMRPVTCVIFNCEILENAFEADTKASLKYLETDLRQTIHRFNELAGMKMDRPLLLWSRESADAAHKKTE